LFSAVSEQLAGSLIDFEVVAGIIGDHHSVEAIIEQTAELRLRLGGPARRWSGR
jgi:hypothetical protein